MVDADYKPIYEQAVKGDAITDWGWLAHHTGGKWRRILYHTASSMEGLLSGMELSALYLQRIRRRQTETQNCPRKSGLPRATPL